MKTLIFNGSPRLHGDTQSLLDLFMEEMSGEIKIVHAYRSSISGCLDCRYCWKQPGCAIQDEMQEVYRFIQEADNILIASPIYFSELTGKLLDVASRLQTYFCGRFFRKAEDIEKPKKGAVILVGGGDGKPDRAWGTAKTLLHHMNAYDIAPLVSYHNTNESPAIEDEKTREGVKDIVRFFMGEKKTPVRNVGILSPKPESSDVARKLLEKLEGK